MHGNLEHEKKAGVHWFIGNKHWCLCGQSKNKIEMKLNSKFQTRHQGTTVTVYKQSCGVYPAEKLILGNILQLQGECVPIES